MDDGDCVVLALQDDQGSTSQWCGCVQAVHDAWGSRARKSIELVGLEPMPLLQDSGLDSVKGLT